jgi:serine/threonine-protein kinase
LYVEACEATHLRGEQSPDVLDLRMACLNDNLDQVRALTDAVSQAEGNPGARAMSAAQSLTPISRCAEVTLLRSAVRLPRDEATLQTVLKLKRNLADIYA